MFDQRTHTSYLKGYIVNLKTTDLIIITACYFLRKIQRIFSLIMESGKLRKIACTEFTEHGLKKIQAVGTGTDSGQ